MQRKAATVQQYLAALPDDRRAALSAVRDVVLANLDRTGFEEGIQYGMIGYFVPHRVYPPGYHVDPSQPLPFAALASQKHHMSLYLLHAYGDDTWLRTAWEKTGKKLDMGKSCLRFKKLDDLALDVIGEAVRRVPAQAYIAQYERALAALGKRPRKTAERLARTEPTARSTKKTTKTASTTARTTARTASSAARTTTTTTETASTSARKAAKAAGVAEPTSTAPRARAAAKTAARPR